MKRQEGHRAYGTNTNACPCCLVSFLGQLFLADGDDVSMAPTVTGTSFCCGFLLIHYFSTARVPMAFMLTDTCCSCICFFGPLFLVGK